MTSGRLSPLLRRRLRRRAGSVWALVCAALLGALPMFAAVPPAHAVAAIVGHPTVAYYIGADGGLYSYGRAADGTWSTAARIGGGGLAPSAGAVAATHAPDGSIVAYFVGLTGGVYQSCPAQRQPSQITASGLGTQGEPIGTVLAQQTGYVVFGNDPGVAADQIPHPCGPTNTNAPAPARGSAALGQRVAPAVEPVPAPWYTGGSLAAAALSDGELAVFGIDAMGAVHALWRSVGGVWTGSVITGNGVAASNAGIAVTPSSNASPTPGALSLFYTGHHGEIYLAHPAPGGLASATVSTAANAPDGALLAAASIASGPYVSLVANGGTVTVIPADNSGNWQSPVAVSAPGFAPPGSSVASSATDAEIEVFFGSGSGQPGHVGYVPHTPGPGLWTPAGTGPSTAVTPATHFGAA